jgi:hypothetical protein
LIEEDSHAALRVSASGFGEALFGVGENGFNVFASHTRKPLQKIVHGCPILEILEESLRRHTSSLENPSATDPPRVALNGGALTPVQHGSRINPIAVKWHGDRVEPTIGIEPMTC